MRNSNRKTGYRNALSPAQASVWAAAASILAAPASLRVSPAAVSPVGAPPSDAAAMAALICKKECYKMTIPSNPDFLPTSNGWGIQPIRESTPFGGGMHDTFRVDKSGDLSGGHTTIEIPGGQKVRLPW